ncbi:alkaline phosphatase family protein [Natrialbaceae archaeon A-gly3]
MKTVVLGFDGLSARYLERFGDSLPTLTTLRERGVETPLESTHPIRPRSVWPSLYTGTDPSHHGVYGAPTFEGYPDEPTPVSRIDVRRPALWDYLSTLGVPSAVLSVPLSHPADPLEGTLVPGEPAREDEPTYPQETREDLAAILGEAYVLSPTAEEVGHDQEELGPVETIDQRRRAFLSVLETDEWRFGLCRVGATDPVAWDIEAESRLRAVYEAADRFVGDVLEAIEERTNVVVCSPYGTRPVSGYRIHVNELLCEEGFLESWGPREHERTHGSDSPHETDGPATLEWALAPLRRLEAGLESLVSSLRPDTPEPDPGERFDWSQSLAYAPPGRAGVRLNLADRDPGGIVSTHSYENAREELLEILARVETPDGDPAFGFVRQRERIYDGPFLEAAPDVLFSPAGRDNTVSARPSSRPFVSVDGYGRDPEGLFLGTGPGFAATEDVDRLTVPDIAPLTLAILEQAVPSLMTGTVPTELISTPVVRTEYPESTYGAAATDPAFDDKELTDRLEGLEYP